MTSPYDEFLDTLNPQDRRIVERYMATGNKKQAAIDEGIPPHLAHVYSIRVLNRPEVVEAMKAKMAEHSEKMEIRTNDVLKGIVAIIKRCEEGEPVYSKSGELQMVINPDDPEGPLIPRRKPDIANALKAYELLGKHLHMFTDRIEHHHSGEVNVNQTVKAIGFDKVLAIAKAKQSEPRVIEGESVGDSGV